MLLGLLILGAVTAMWGFSSTTVRWDADVGVVPGAHAATTTQFAPRSTPATSASRPTGLRLPTRSVETAVVPVGTRPDGALVVPDDVDTVGWWSAGAAPGSGSGTVVIAGHVDSAAQGRGAFFHLVDLPVGTTVGLDTGADVIIYRVVAIRQYVKRELPPEVFSRNGVPRLVLITCGGDFDRVERQYSDNIVVYAVPT